MKEKFSLQPELAESKKNEKPFDETRRSTIKKIAVAALGLVFNKQYHGLLFDDDNKIKDLNRTYSKVLNKKEGSAIKEIKSPIEIIEEILRTFNTNAVSSRIDSNVLTNDFFMALQFQESRYDPKAVSEKGAQGVFQDLPKATMGVVEYLSLLRKKGQDTYTKKPCDYRGPDSITFEQAEAIGSLLKEKGDYGRAVGKLYLLAMHDKESKFNSFPNADVFRNLDPQGRPLSGKPKSPEEQQDLLALSYHDGPKRRFDPKQASVNGANYLRYAHRHMALIKNLRDRLELAGMSRKNDYAIIKILKKLDRPEDKKNPEAAIRRYLKLLQDVHIAHGIIHKDRILASHEIDRIFENV